MPYTDILIVTMPQIPMQVYQQLKDQTHHPKFNDDAKGSTQRLLEQTDLPNDLKYFSLSTMPEPYLELQKSREYTSAYDGMKQYR